MDVGVKQLSELVKQLQGGDGKAFEQIYNLTYEKAYFTALKICKNEDDAEDVLQEAYIQLLRKSAEIKNPDSFMSWFNMIVANESRNLLRKNKPSLFGSEEEEQFVLDSIPDEDEEYHPAADVEQDELKSDVMELIDNLSDEKRTAVVLYYYNEMTTKEIAESLGVNENTVKSRLVQAKKDLAKGVEGLKKKNRSLFGVAPMPLIIWALRGTAKTSGEAFAAGGGAAAALAAVNAASAGTAASGVAAAAGTAGGIAAKIAGMTVAQKIIAGVVTVGIISGGAVGAKTAADRKKADAVNAGAGITEQTAAVAEKSPEYEAENAVEHEALSGTAVSEKSVTEKPTEQGAAVPTQESGTSSSGTTKTTGTTKATKASTTTTAATTTTTTTTTTTVGKATVTIYVFEGDRNTRSNYADMRTVTIDAGSSFSRSDAASAVGLSLEDIRFQSGASITNAQAGGTYVFEINN